MTETHTAHADRAAADAESTLADRYQRLAAQAGGHCPIEAGTLGALADNECRHGRLAGDRTPPCGCFRSEDGKLYNIRPIRPARREGRQATRRAA